MFKDNFRFILRRAARQKVHTILHILGLSLGLSVCIIIGLFLQHEYSYDTYHEKADRTFRVNQIWKGPNSIYREYSVPFPMAPSIRENIPDVEQVAQVYPVSRPLIEINSSKRFEQEFVLLAEPGFLDIFDIEVLEGNGHEVLRTPYQALLTESTAEHFFGREAAVGKTFKFKNKYDITVGGIIRDLPSNTHLPAKILLSFVYDEEFVGYPIDEWTFTAGASTFVLLPEGQTPDLVHDKINALAAKNGNPNPDEPEKSSIDLQPLKNIHLEPQYSGGGPWVEAINPSWLWFFGFIGLTVLTLACINFVNLTTAQSLTRAREVGVRKAIGADRKQLIAQFIGEAFFLLSIAALVAVLMTQVAIPYINQLTDKSLEFQSLFRPLPLLASLGGLLLTGLLTGAYPAWLSSKFKTADALKTTTSFGDKSSALLRKILVVFQFTISVSLLIALLLMSRQMDLFHQKNMGFDQENIVLFNMPDKSKRDLLKAELDKIPQLTKVSFANCPPAGGGKMTTIMSEINLDDPNRKDVELIFGDEHYASLFNLELKTGRFPKAGDTSAIASHLPKDEQSPRVVVNEQFVKEMGYESEEAAIGKKFYFGYNNWRGEIIGVMKDFNTSSLHRAIRPVLYTVNPRSYRRSNIKIAAGDHLPSTLAAIETAWTKTFPEGIYSFHFLDERIERYYSTERKLYSIFKIFTLIAMLISCLGLWGLATFAAHQRTREIGIRKVLGANILSITSLLTKDFILLVGIAILVAAPLAWYGMHEWLQNFAFRIEISWTVFGLAGILAISVAVLTVSWQSIRAAIADPIKALKNE